MITALHIRSDGSMELFEYEREHALDALQEKVGGWIEVAPTSDRTITMYCNEEGKLDNLPLNPKATQLLSTVDVIAGDVVIVGPPDKEGYDTSLPLPWAVMKGVGG